MIAPLVMIDPGHGGADTGAVSGGVRESHLVLPYALDLRDVLQRRGYRTALTRTADTAVALGERTRQANDQGADLFVSIHANASGAATAAGFQVFHARPSSPGQAAAEAIWRHVEPIVGRTDRSGVFTDQSIHVGYTTAAQQHIAALNAERRAKNQPPLDWKAADAAVVRVYGAAAYRTLHVLRATRMPAVLLELGFMTNAPELSRMLTRDYRQHLVTAVADGIGRVAPAPALPAPAPTPPADRPPAWLYSRTDGWILPVLVEADARWWFIRWRDMQVTSATAPRSAPPLIRAGTPLSAMPPPPGR